MSLRVAVVGAGKMGAHHARVFARVATLVGVTDVDGARASSVAAAHGCRVLDSVDQAINGADLVVVATPTEVHFDHASRALAAGRHVLVEKPLCADAPAAWTLCDLARSVGRELFVGHSERFNAVIRAMVGLLEGEMLEEVTTHRLLAARANVDEPCLNLAVHDIDLVAFLSGQPVELEHAVSDGTTVDLALRAGDARASVTVGCADMPLRTLELRTVRSVHHGDLLKPHARADEPLALQAAAVVAAVEGRCSAVARGVDGARAVALARRAAVSLHDARVSAAE
jgi:predicted dehydrogenase